MASKNTGSSEEQKIRLKPYVLKCPKCESTILANLHGIQLVFRDATANTVERFWQHISRLDEPSCNETKNGGKEAHGDSIVPHELLGLISQYAKASGVKKGVAPISAGFYWLIGNVFDFENIGMSKAFYNKDIVKNEEKNDEKATESENKKENQTDEDQQRLIDNLRFIICADCEYGPLGYHAPNPDPLMDAENSDGRRGSVGSIDNGQGDGGQRKLSTHGQNAQQEYLLAVNRVRYL